MKQTDDLRAIEIEAEIVQVKSMANGSARIVIEMPEYCLTQASALMMWVNRFVHVLIEVADVPPYPKD